MIYKTFTSYFLMAAMSSLLITGCGEDAHNEVVVGNASQGSEDDDRDDGGSTGGDTGDCTFAGIASAYTDCMETTQYSQLDLVTWNIEDFSQSNTDIDKLADVITNLNADIIAVQEIQNIDDFTAMAETIDGWEATVKDISGSLDLGFLYKSCEIESITEPVTIDGISPRPGVMVNVRHVSGLEVSIITVHLKCCSEGEETRTAASETLKAYIDTNLADAKVVMVGDYNDDLAADGPFSNFIADSENYRFADADIAAGSTAYWSYPSWPSHLDHVLITNELFDKVVSIETLLLNQCVDDYYNDLSDHRPVMVRFSAE